jgi:hypothetical protein
MEKTRVSRFNLPNLRALVDQGRTILIVGGVPKPRKLENLKAKLEGDFSLEWPNLGNSTASRMLAPITDRIRKGNVACVLLVNGIMSHQTSDRVVLACKEGSAPFRIVEKAGQQSILLALQDIERSLT